MTKLGESFSIGDTRVTYGSLVTLALFAFIWFVLTQTTWGRRVYALGDNPEATRLMGIPVRKQLLMVYVVAGIIYGIAALLLVARTGVGDPNAGITDNLDAITAVVLGGTSLFGGRGTIIGTLIGALIIGVVRNGLVLMGVASHVPGPDHRHPGHRRRLRRPDREEARMSTTTENRDADPVGARDPQALRQRDRHRRRRLRPLPRRDPRRDRGQRSRQVEPDQGALGRHHPRLRDGQPRRGGGQLQVPARGAAGRHRDGLPGPRRGARARHRDQPVPRSREEARRPARAACSACSTTRACRRRPTSR